MKYITYLFFRYGLFAMFFIILIEYACFPISSEIVLPFSGAFASLQNIHFLIILPVSVAAGLIGTSICYLIGWKGGNALINAIIRRFPKSENGMNSAKEKFNKHGAMAVCIGRVIPLCRTYIAFFAGAARLSPLKFILASALGITTWNTLLIGLGYVFRENYGQVATYYLKFKSFILPVTLFILMFFIIRFIRNRIRNKNN